MIYACLSCGAQYHAPQSGGCTVPFVIDLDGTEYACGGPVVLSTEEGKVFPMLDGPPIPWSLAEQIYERLYTRLGHRQPLKTIARRGGFGWSEVALMHNKALKTLGREEKLYEVGRS